MEPLISSEGLNPDNAIEIADGVWWVGHFLEGDPFQCHVYLIEHGDQSVLIDPGSKLTFNHTLRKIEQVTSFSNIRYFICQHQDPDITGAMQIIDNMISRDDAVLATHWRAMVLLRHYGLKVPFWLVNENDWMLDIGGRKISFTFTPYAHFPGAFCSFDEQTQTLFSSDLFGGFTEGFSLVAKDETYFEALRPFHEHYMPSRDILTFSINELQQNDIKIIAPQHGSIIPNHLVDFMMEKLKHLDCGLFLLASETSDIYSISKMNKILQEITETMVLYRDFRDIASALTKIIQQMIPAESLEFYLQTEEDGQGILHLAPESRYRGTFDKVPEYLSDILGIKKSEYTKQHGKRYLKKTCPESKQTALIIPLFNQEKQFAKDIAIIKLKQDIEINSDIEQMIEQTTVPLQVAVERESIYRFLEVERQKHYERSIRDSLTGMFTRYYMTETITRQFEIHDREGEPEIALAMFDIDHFKKVNDTFGHDVGDLVLTSIAAIIRNSSRGGDIPVRLGGEEFALFVIGKSALGVASIADRIRTTIERLEFKKLGEQKNVTISGGIGTRQQKESLEGLFKRVDKALYNAKHTGRNRICDSDKSKSTLTP